MTIIFWSSSCPAVFPVASPTGGGRSWSPTVPRSVVGFCFSSRTWTLHLTGRSCSSPCAPSWSCSGSDRIDSGSLRRRGGPRSWRRSEAWLLARSPRISTGVFRALSGSGPTEWRSYSVGSAWMPFAWRYHGPLLYHDRKRWRLQHWP